jgi:hypothetical protein
MANVETCRTSRPPISMVPFANPPSESVPTVPQKCLQSELHSEHCDGGGLREKDCLLSAAFLTVSTELDDTSYANYSEL